MIPQQEILNLTMSTIADTEIIFSEPVKTVTIQNRAADDLQYRASSGAATYQTIVGGSSLSFNLPKFATKNCGWLRAGGGTGPAEVLGLLA
jgi:hypothetical protein